MGNTNKSTAVIVRENGELSQQLRNWSLRLAMRLADDAEALEPMARKIVNMRLFPDPEGDSHVHRSLLEEKAELLVVSQSTLYADCRKWPSPGFSAAAPPARSAGRGAAFVEFLLR